MALKLQYVGSRQVVKIRLNAWGDTGEYWFSRGQIRDDIPEGYIRDRIEPLIANGGTAWKIINDNEKSEAMLSVVTEEKSVVAKPVAKTETEKSEAMLAAVNESTPEFDQSMSRAEMMAWCKSKGIKTSTKDTKSTLTEKALAFNAGADE